MTRHSWREIQYFVYNQVLFYFNIKTKRKPNQLLNKNHIIGSLSVYRACTTQVPHVSAKLSTYILNAFI